MKHSILIGCSISCSLLRGCQQNSGKRTVAHSLDFHFTVKGEGSCSQDTPSASQELAKEMGLPYFRKNVGNFNWTQKCDYLGSFTRMELIVVVRELKSQKKLYFKIFYHLGLHNIPKCCMSGSHCCTSSLCSGVCKHNNCCIITSEEQNGWSWP